jgi:hypothetical protein
MAAYTNAASAQDYYYDDHGDAKRADAAAEHLRHCGRVLDVQLAVAEAAIAIVEQQEAVGHNEFADVVMRLGELREQYRAARDRAKAANQS